MKQHAVQTATVTPRRRASLLAAMRSEARLGVAMIAVPVLGALAFGVAPLLYIAWYSLHDWSPLAGRFDFVGIENYAFLFESRTFQTSLVVTGIFVLGVVVAETVVAMSLALLLNRRIRGIGLFRAAYFAPVVIAYVAWVLVWDYLLASNGTINSLLAAFGIVGPDWLHSPSWALGSVVVVVLFKGVGQNMILFLAALQAVPRELLEAAAIDGATATKRFFRITLPLMTPTVLMVLILTTVGALNIFVPIQLMTEGGPGNSTNVLSYYIYEIAFKQQEFGLGSAVAVVLFVIVLALTVSQWGLRKKWVHDEF
ncbi:MAG TPA: sugar ABC transporter permease [Terrimesophilobacter sp.]|nr:sugar ABC transporter permease [Terrimesophilobacter sp.]